MYVCVCISVVRISLVLITPALICGWISLPSLGLWRNKLLSLTCKITILKQNKATLSSFHPLNKCQYIYRYKRVSYRTITHWEICIYYFTFVYVIHVCNFEMQSFTQTQIDNPHCSRSMQAASQAGCKNYDMDIMKWWIHQSSQYRL